MGSVRLEYKQKMPKLERLPNDDFNRDVTAVAMDDRFYLVGQNDGTLAAVYISNGKNVFREKISDYAITAVACEEKDDADNQIFYCGDEKGNLFTVNKKGKTVKETSIPERKGNIHIIANKDKYQIYVYTCKGSQSLSHTTTDFRKGNFTTSTSNYSVDGDGTFHKKKGSGDFDVIQFNARTPSKIVATCAMEFGRKVGNYEEVLAYAIIDNEYENLVEDGTADKSFKVLKNGKELRSIEFKSPVKQIMSCRHHEGKAEADDIYIMLWNGIVYKVNGSKLADESIDNDALGMEVVAKVESDSSSSSSSSGSDDEDEDGGELNGFCVYNNRLVVYGNDGLFAAKL